MHQFKGGELGQSVERGIVLIFRPQEELFPLLRILVNMKSQVLLERSISQICLPVCLRMISRTHGQASSLHLKKFLPKIADEHPITPSEDRMWYSVQMDDIFYKQSSDGFGGVRMYQWNEVRVFGKMVNYHHYSVKPI